MTAFLRLLPAGRYVRKYLELIELFEWKCKKKYSVCDYYNIVCMGYFFCVIFIIETVNF